MARAKARILNIFGQTVIIKRNPWHNPRLYKALVSLGKLPKKGEYILTAPVPWFGDPSKMPPAVFERARLFSQVASQTAGMPIETRLKTIQQQLRTGRKPRPSKAKPTGQRFHELYPSYEAVRRIEKPAFAEIRF